MPSRQTAVRRGIHRARTLIRRIGEELRVARIAAGVSTRRLAAIVGISHTQVRRSNEAGLAPHVDIDVLARMAAALGYELGMGMHPVGSPVRDAAHLRLLGRFRARLHQGLAWRTEVPVPIEGDLRTADGTIQGAAFGAVVEAETRLSDVQAVERRGRVKVRDLDADRLILLVADTRHDRAVVASTPGLAERFPIGTRACLAALRRGEDPGGDCLVVL